MPLFSQENFNNSILMKRLQTSQTNLYTKSTKESQSSNVPASSNSNNYDRNTEDNLTADILYSDHIIYQKDPNGFAHKPNKFADNCVPISKNIENLDLFKSLISSSSGSGIIFSDPNIKVDLKIKLIERNCIGLIFSFISSTGDSIDEIDLQQVYTKNNLNFNMSKVKYNNDGTPPQIFLKIYLIESFNIPTSASLTARVGMMNLSSKFTLPVLITKFLSPFKTNIENYSMLWYAMSSENEPEYHKLDCILNNPSNGKLGVMDFLKKLGTLLVSLNFHLFPPLDLTNFHEIEAAAILEYQPEIEPITILAQAKFIPSYNSEFRFSIRAKVPKEIKGFESITTDVLSVIKFYVNP
jgi:hypothetical protein